LGFRFALSGATARRVGGLGRTDGTTEGVVVHQEGESVPETVGAGDDGNGRERTARTKAVTKAVEADGREVGEREIGHGKPPSRDGADSPTTERLAERVAYYKSQTEKK